MGEYIQELGRNYVYEMKDFLKDTFNFHNLVTSYAPNALTLIEKYDGSTKTFDLVGIYQKYNEPIQVFIEVKNDSNSSRLFSEYKCFMKDCFSVWVKKRELTKGRWKGMFLYISNYPFYCSNFRRLKTLDFLEKLSDNFERTLKSYFEAHRGDILSNFLNFTEILILTPSREIINTNISNIIKEYKIFT